MSTWLYTVKYSEITRVDGSEEPDTGIVDQLSVLGDDAEDAIAKVRQYAVGQKRNYTDDEESKEVHGTVENISVDSAERISFVDLE